MKTKLKPLIDITTSKIEQLKSGKIAESPYALGLERPANHEVLGEDITISGWFIDFENHPIKIKALIDGYEFCEVQRDHERPDVAAHFRIPDHLLGNKNIGFNHKIPWSELENKVEVHLVIKILRGAQSLQFGPFVIRKTDHPVLRHQRGSYKDVWESAAADENSARATVTGESSEDFAPSGEASAKTISELLEIDENCEVLEIGCGTGRIGKALSPKVKRWVGTDISSNMLKYAKEYLADLENIELVELFDVGLRQIPDNSFDRVYCCCVFMHLDEWDRYTYVKEAFRVLKPGGRFYVDNLNIEGDQGWAVFEQMWALDPAQRSAAASKVSSPQEFGAYFKRAGFRATKLNADAHLVMCTGQKPA